MESEAKYFAVGIGVIVLTMCTILFSFWLSGLGKDRRVATYSVYFKDQTLDGLQVDSQVTMKGIKVGSVSEFFISPKDIERVKVIIKISDETPIKNDTQAVIKRNLLTGLASIDLIGSSKYSELLTQVAEGEDYPVIPEGQTELQSIASSLPGAVSEFADVARRANAILSDENHEALTKSLANLERFTAALAANDHDIAASTKTVGETSREITKFVRALNKDGRSEQIAVELVSLLKQGAEMAKNLDQRSDAIASSLTNSARIISIDIGKLARDLSLAAQAFTNTIEKFDNPSQILSGPKIETLGPGERIKR